MISATLTRKSARSAFDGGRFVSSVSHVMQLTTQRKVSIGFVTLALAGFGLTFVGGTNPPQPAGHKAQASHAAAIKSAPIDETEAQLAQLSVIHHRLESASSAEKIDLSHTPDAFKPCVGVAESKPAVDPAAEAAAAAAKFRQQHRLLAVIKSGRAAVALVDGKTLRPGQSLGGFKLVAVRERSVVFDSGVAKVELLVTGSDPTAAASDELLIVPSRSGNDQ